MDVILHIGAGQGEQLEDWLASEARRIVLFEPHPGLAKRLTHASEGQPRVSVVPVAIATEAGGCSLQEYNLPEANSLRAPTALKQLFPGLKKVNHYPVQAITPDQMMAEYGPANNAPARLVIEAPGEAHAILQPLVEHDLLDRFTQLQISMTVIPCYKGSVPAEKTLEMLRDYGFDVVRHDDHDPDWPTWTLHRNALKVEFKQLQQAFNQAEQEQAQAREERDSFEKQLAELQQARKSEQTQAREERDSYEKQLAEQQAARTALEQEYKKQQQALEQAEEKFLKTHRFFMTRKQQALELEERVKELTSALEAARATHEQQLAERQQTLAHTEARLAEFKVYFHKRKKQAIEGEETIKKLQAELAEKNTRLASLEASLNDYQQRYTQGLLAPVRDVSQVDFKTARQWYQREGALTDTQRALESLRLRGEAFDEEQQAFQAKVEGLLRLKSDFQLPARQTRPVLTSLPHQVLYCLHQSVPHATNGYATRSHGIAKGLRQAGINVCATTRPGFPWDAGITGLNAPQHEAAVEGITYVAVEGAELVKTPLDHYLEEAAQHFEHQARACAAEIVAAASNHITALPALMAARRLGLPFVYEVRGLWEVTQASTQPAWADSEHYRVMRKLERQSASEADLVIALTDELADELTSWGVARERIEVVPNAVDAERFQPMAKDPATLQELNLTPGVPVIGYAGSAVAYEGLELLMEALARLKQQGQAFTFVLIGDGNAIDSVKGKARELEIEEACRFTGRVSFEQVPRYLSCMDIMPIPRLSSAVTEMVSELKPLEAMAMGKALVLSDVSPHIAMAGSNSERAKLFTKDSAESLSEALQQLIDSPEERQRLGQAARAWIEQERTWNHVTLKYAEVLERVRPEHRERLVSPVSNGPTTTSLIDLAKRLAANKEAKLNSVEGLVAVVASQPWRENPPGYAKRVQQLAKRFQASGWEPLCMVSPFGAGNEEQVGKPEAVEDGVRYLYGQWPLQAAPTSAESGFISSVEIFSKWFKAHRPQVVVAAGDFTSALPAIVAARQLSLPVIKEQLHYADAFQERQTHRLFERLDFAQKFAAEQACLELADGGYYLDPEADSGWKTLQEVVQRTCGKAPQATPMAVLKPKTRYTVKQCVEGEGLYYLELDVEDTVSGNPKGIVGSFRFLDVGGKPLTQPVEGFASSKDFPHYQYVDTSAANGRQRVVVFQLPAGVSQVEVDVVAFVTKERLTLHHASIGKVSIATVARWLSLRAAGVQWIKGVESHVHKEGAASLRLALLDYKQRLSKHPNDQNQLNGAIQEMVELDRTWLPAIAYRPNPVKLKATDALTVAHLHKTAYPYENSGGAIRCLNTALSQKRIGMAPYIITPIGYPRSVGIEGAKNHEVIEGIEHFRIGGNTDGLRGISLPDRTSYSTFHLAKLIKERGANVIHAASGVRGYELALQALALKKLTGLPLLYEVRSFHEHTWTPVRSDAIELEKTQLRIIKEDFCMAEADFVTTISFSMQKILIERGVEPEKVAVIPNAIDESKYLGKTFSPMPIPALEGAEMVVGYISNMSRREGHQYLIRAIHQLRQRTGRDIRGLMVGNGPERNNLERLAAELGISDVIAFPGEVDHSQINAYYKAIDLFVIPRIPDYAADWVTPLKPYEAMALERPIIVSDLPALKEIVGDNEERGLVAKPADVESLVTQLQRYIDDPAMRQRKVNTAREWVFAERTWSANAKRYDAIYRRLMASHGTSEKEALHA